MESFEEEDYLQASARRQLNADAVEGESVVWIKGEDQTISPHYACLHTCLISTYNGTEDIPKNATITYKIELVKIEPAIDYFTMKA